MANYLDEAIAALRRFEGVVPWMYLDTLGKVTVGVGLMLPSLEAARGLPFLLDGEAATTDEVAKEFARVSAMKPGMVATLYRKAKGLTISDETIDSRLHQSLLGFETYLRSHVSGYDDLPDGAKLGLLDMAYNVGPGRLFAEFPRLIKAVLAGDWQAAAVASARRGPGKTRNDWTRQQFLSAATILRNLKAEATATAWRPLLGGALSLVAAGIATALLAEEADRALNHGRLRLFSSGKPRGELQHAK